MGWDQTADGRLQTGDQHPTLDPWDEPLPNTLLNVWTKTPRPIKRCTSTGLSVITKTDAEIDDLGLRADTKCDSCGFPRIKRLSRMETTLNGAPQAHVGAENDCMHGQYGLPLTHV